MEAQRLTRRAANRQFWLRRVTLRSEVCWTPMWGLPGFPRRRQEAVLDVACPSTMPKVAAARLCAKNRSTSAAAAYDRPRPPWLLRRANHREGHDAPDG